MPKLKTNKSVRNRFKITRTGAILRRPTKQSHFLAKRGGKKRRGVRGFVHLSKADRKGILRYAKSSRR